MPIRKHVVQGDEVRLVVLPRFNMEAVAAWDTFCESDDLFGLDVETTAPPSFEGARKLFGPALALKQYVVPDDVPLSYQKRGYLPGETHSVKVRAIQFATKTEAWVFDVADPEWRPFVQNFLNNSEIRFVSHNASFDTTRVLHEYGIRLGTRSIDTLPMAGLIWPGRTAPTEGRGKGLKELCSWCMEDAGLVEAEKALQARFADLYPWSSTLPKNHVPGSSPCRNCKDEPSMFTSVRGFGVACYDAAVGLSQAVIEWGWDNIPIDDRVFTSYAGLDAVYVRRLVDVLAYEIKRRHMAALSKDEQRVKRLMVHRTNRGMKVDLDWTREVQAEVGEEFEVASRDVLERTGLKARSPKMRMWLAENGCRTKSLDKDHRPALLAQFADPASARYSEIVGPVLQGIDDVLSNANLLTNLATIRRHAEGGNGFAHPNVNTIQAHTGRMSVTGPAMQTFAKSGLKGTRLRGCFVARPGHVFVGADWDNQETRIAAALSGDAALNRIVAENLNQHVLTAESIFPAFISKVESPGEYHSAKTLDFAQQYGAMPRKIAQTLGISEPEARAMWLGWRETYAGLVDWTDTIATKRFIRNPFGRVIPADEYGRAYANGNYMIQSTGRDCLGKALCTLADEGWGSSIWLPVHDEIILEVLEAKAEQAALALGEAMTMHLPQQEWAPIKVDVVIPATGEVIGDRWRGLA